MLPSTWDTTFGDAVLRSQCLVIVVIGPWNHWRIPRSISCLWSKLMLLELHCVSRPKGFFWDCAEKSRRIGGAGSKCSSSASYTAPIGSSDVTFASFSWMMWEFNAFAESDVNKLSTSLLECSMPCEQWKVWWVVADPELVAPNLLSVKIKSKILILPIEQPIPGPEPLKDQKLPVVWFVRCCELEPLTISGEHLLLITEFAFRHMVFNPTFQCCPSFFGLACFHICWVNSISSCPNLFWGLKYPRI